MRTAISMRHLISRVGSRACSVGSAVSRTISVSSSLSVARTFSTAAAPRMSKFLGGKSEFTPRLEFEKGFTPLKCFRIMDETSNFIDPNYKINHDDATLVRMYTTMLKLNAMDSIFYDAQRQGRISFYMTATGEEATHIGSASALQDDDMIFAQYREAGVLMWRGFTLDNFAHQCFSTSEDLGKGRQMPVHYGSNALHFQTISSPLATQLPQAVGAAYAFKREKNGRVAICYFGEGAASEGDVHVAFNMAGTLSAPIIFFCRNNGYAISTPSSEQYKGDGIAGRARGYGMTTIRVDGNDLLAVHDATARARELALANNEPVMVEAMTYRGGHHSTSDDSTRYRGAEEIAYWSENENPITRMRHLLERLKLWDSDKETATRKEARSAVLASLTTAEQTTKPPMSQLFTDVYDELTPLLKEQQAEMQQHLVAYGAKYGLDEFKVESS